MSANDVILSFGGASVFLFLGIAYLWIAIRANRTGTMKLRNGDLVHRELSPKIFSHYVFAWSCISAASLVAGVIVLIILIFRG